MIGTAYKDNRVMLSQDDFSLRCTSLLHMCKHNHLTVQVQCAQIRVQLHLASADHALMVCSISKTLECMAAELLTTLSVFTVYPQDTHDSTTVHNSGVALLLQ